jgi:hypothetical protein
MWASMELEGIADLGSGLSGARNRFSAHETRIPSDSGAERGRWTSSILASVDYFGSREMQASSYLPEPMAPSGKILCAAIQPKDLSKTSFV